MDNISTSDLFIFQKECKDRIAAATKEIKVFSLLLPALNEEIEVRKNEYEMDRDL